MCVNDGRSHRNEKIKIISTYQCEGLSMNYSLLVDTNKPGRIIHKVLHTAACKKLCEYILTHLMLITVDAFG